MTLRDPSPCPACAEPLPVEGVCCPSCGERLGPTSYRPLPPLALRRVSAPGSVALGVFGPLALLMLGLLGFDSHLGLRWIPFVTCPLFVTFAVFGASRVWRDLRRPGRDGGLPLLVGLVLGLVLAVALLAALGRALDHLDFFGGRALNESSAIGSLKTISFAQALFREADKENDGNLDYGTLQELSTAGTTGLIDSVLASGTKNGYLFECHYGLRTSEFLWYATATPVIPGTSGDRYFVTNHEGVTFYTTSGAFRLNLDDCTLPAGAVPIGR